MKFGTAKKYSDWMVEKVYKPLEQELVNTICPEGVRKKRPSPVASPLTEVLYRTRELHQYLEYYT